MSKTIMVMATSLVLAFGIACTKTESVSRTDAVKAALTQAELTDVSVSEDRDKNTITLGGSVHSDAAKAQAASVAEAPAAGRTVVNEISVQPVGLESEAKSANSKTDDAIEKNYDAALIHHGLDKQHIRYDAKNGVLTLKGNVKSSRARIEAAKLAESIPNVQQVVNQIEEK
jgi:osmotically-inducible protein OsmY